MSFPENLPLDPPIEDACTKCPPNCAEGICYEEHPDGQPKSAYCCPCECHWTDEDWRYELAEQRRKP